MRTWVGGLMLAAGLSVGCHSSAASQANVPVLFPSGGQYALQDAQGKATAYCFVDSDAQPGRQTIRWLLMDDFVSPLRQMTYVVRMPQVSGSGGIAGCAADFADIARKVMKRNDHCTYVKSYADTFTESYDPAGSEKPRTIAQLPVPAGRRAPDPPGHLPPTDWFDPKTGKSQQIDGGTVGIKPPPPVNEYPPPPTPPPVGGGFLDPKWIEDPGVIGMSVASPQRESNVEYWFLPKMLFERGLEGAILLPFANQKSDYNASPEREWAVVVVNSSYYPGFVPNEW